MKEEYPLYYKCILTNDSSFTLNKIYIIQHPENLERYDNFIDDDGNENGWCGRNHKHFTSVTEEEYQLQEGLISQLSKDIVDDNTQLIKLLQEIK